MAAANSPATGSVQPTKQSYNVRELPVKSVTLYPSRAHVTREISDVQLRRGGGEIEIVGISPTVDEHSIQVESHGSLDIVDMSVQLVPNRDIYDDIYPEDDEPSEDESDIEYEDSDDDTAHVKLLSKEIKALQDQAATQTEKQNSANARLETLDRYASSANAEHVNPGKISELLSNYDIQRANAFESHKAATNKLSELEKQIRRKQVERANAGQAERKQKERAEQQKLKQERRRRLKKAEISKEAKHVRDERMRYWAKKVYRVTLLLESPSLDTPVSSRRSSLDSVTLASHASPEAKQISSEDPSSEVNVPVVSLLLSYVTKEAGWSPRYDLQISSTQKTARIIYRTEYWNRTCETWKDTKLSFSTSQTSYSGLDDAVPFMHAWHIKLSRHNQGNGGLLSNEEARVTRGARPDADVFDRAELFGLDDFATSAWHRSVQSESKAAGRGLGAQSIDLFSSTSTPFGGHRDAVSGGADILWPVADGVLSAPGESDISQPVIAKPQGVPASTDLLDLGTPTSAGVGRTHTEARYRRSSGVRAQKKSASLGGMFGVPQRLSSSMNYSSKAEQYDPTIEDMEAKEAVPPPFSNRNGDDDDEDTAWEDNGLTTTYDVPGTRTLEPSSLTRRLKIVSLQASNIQLSHICVPKLRSAAFLRAKVRNPSSSVTLLKGSAGVTLDGTFLGNMTLPRVSPTQTFELSLGVDPAVHVSYPKPSVYRSTQGILFNKESAQIFTRSIWLSNTRSAPVDLLVLDQIPVSEDERLRVAVLQPRGLGKEGDSAKAGVSAKEGSSGGLTATESAGKNGKTEAWGSAVAKWKKGGEISWAVLLEAGKGCLLKLEYEARLPNVETIIETNHHVS